MMLHDTRWNDGLERDQNSQSYSFKPLLSIGPSAQSLGSGEIKIPTVSIKKILATNFTSYN